MSRKVIERIKDGLTKSKEELAVIKQREIEHQAKIAEIREKFIVRTYLIIYIQNLAIQGIVGMYWNT